MSLSIQYNKKRLSRKIITVGFIFSFLLMHTTPSNALVNKLMLICNSGMCPYYKVNLEVPKGWQVDKIASSAHRINFLVEEGKTFNNSPAMIYASATWNRENKTLNDLIKGHIQAWQEQNHDTEVIKNKAFQGLQLFQFKSPKLHNHQKHVSN